MENHFLSLLYTLLVSITLLECQQHHLLPDGGQIWALLVAGSSGYINYRHQADVCHAYQILHRNGIPDSNIIVMMHDDIAFSKDNPTQGIIINKPNGPNVYPGVLKDYTGKDVNVKNFLNVLSGNKTAMQGIGSGRVIDSGPNDHIFLNFVDHGSIGMLLFEDEELLASDFINAIEKMDADKRFKKMVVYIEACYSGSMFDNLLPDDLNIFVTTATDPHESSYAMYYDNKRNTYLGDVFSEMWMDDSEDENLAVESLNHQFQRVRTLTNTSHVEEYGDLDIGTTKLKEVIGFNPESLKSRKSDRTKIDAVPQDHVAVALLTKALAWTDSPEEAKEIHGKLQQLFKKREEMNKMIRNILEKSIANVKHLYKVLASRPSLTKRNIQCYEDLVKHLSSRCFSIAQNPYATTLVGKFSNLCNLPSFNSTIAKLAMNEVCSNNIILKGVL
uniref:legumain n=1 Tax=Clastoptera arizonana TaxID=38151 RepID=A0A1B6DRR5_9HEMI